MAIIIGAVRRNPATVVVLAGQASEGLLAAVGRSMNVSLVRAEESVAGSGDGLEAAAGALRRAAGISSPYVQVAAESSLRSRPPAAHVDESEDHAGDQQDRHEDVVGDRPGPVKPALRDEGQEDKDLGHQPAQQHGAAE